MFGANELVAKGFRILNGQEKIDPDLYSYRSEAAIATFLKALAANPNMFRAWIGLGISYAYSPSTFDESLSAFLKAQAIDAQHPDSYYQLGRLFLHRAETDYEKALPEEYEQALHFFSEADRLGYEDRGELYNLKGTTYFRIKRYDEALKCFERSAAETQDGSWLPSTYFLAAQINELNGNLEEAIRWYELYVAKGFGGRDVMSTLRNLKTTRENQLKAK